MSFATPLQWILSIILVASSLGIIITKKPVHSCLFFLSTLLALAAIYADLSAGFIATMQILIYAGAILVIFMFVIILFQDAHGQIAKYKARSSFSLLLTSGIAFVLALVYLGYKLIDIDKASQTPEGDFGTVQALGYDLYINFFFPFEAIVMIFLVALVGALFIGKKEV